MYSKVVSIMLTFFIQNTCINVVSQCIIVCSVLSYQAVQSLGLIFIEVNTVVLGYS